MSAAAAIKMRGVQWFMLEETGRYARSSRHTSANLVLVVRKVRRCVVVECWWLFTHLLSGSNDQ